MPRWITYHTPVVPYGNVGDVVTADTGRRYVIAKIDGSKVWLKHPGKNGRKLGSGKPRWGIMQGNPADTKFEEFSESQMTGVFKSPKRIIVQIL